MENNSLIPEPPKTGAQLIAIERERQMSQEGWTAEHDDGKDHRQGEIAIAAACYIFDYVSSKYPEDIASESCDQIAGDFWPWAAVWFKPTRRNPICQLVKAGALIAAEIDRLERIRAKQRAMK